MGIENMRRWPMYIVFAVCILLTLSLFNSWGLETELRTELGEMGTQLRECSKQQAACMEDSLTLAENKEIYVSKTKNLEKEKRTLTEELTEYKSQLMNAQKHLNKSINDFDMCTTELQSLKDLQLTKSATLETLRLEKETLTIQLTERKEKIGELEKEVERLKSALTTKSAANQSPSSKVSPAAAPPKQQSPSLDANNPIHEPVLENNDAKEDLEDTMVNDNNDFDPQV